MLLPQQVQAEKYDWQDKSYNFKKINTILVKDLDYSESKVTSKIVQKNLNTLFQERAQKEKIPAITPNIVLQKIALTQGVPLDKIGSQDPAAKEQEEIYQQHIQDVADAYIEVQVLKFANESVYVPETTEWDRVDNETRIVDKDGKVSTIHDYITVPVYKPAHYENEFFVKLSMSLVDAKTHQPIFSREEERSRENDNGMGMFERISNSFFNSIHKLIK